MGVDAEPTFGWAMTIDCEDEDEPAAAPVDADVLLACGSIYVIIAGWLTDSDSGRVCGRTVG